MKKIVIHKPGDYSVLKIEEHEIPSPEDDEVLIATKYIGINYADIIVRWGLYKSAKDFVGWPITPGFEVSGVVLSVGKKVTQFKAGESVFAVTRFGGYTSHLNVQEGFVFHLPRELSLEEAAAFPAVYLTAYHALFQNVVIHANSKILIHSAAGGVGSALIQLAHTKNFDITGVVGSSHKVKFVENMGASHVIDKSTQNLWKEAENISPTGFDIILDANGAETLKQSYNHLASSGKLLCYGFHSMLPKSGGKVDWIKLIKTYFKTPRFSPLDMTSENKSVVAFNLSYLFDKKEIFKEAMQELIKLLEKGSIKGPAVTVYPFEQVGLAHKALESGKTTGKVVLKL